MTPRRRLLAVERLEERCLLAADFGDAPTTFGTAAHEAVGPTLGALRDVDVSTPSLPGAVGDGVDDDGVTLGTLRVGQMGAVITVNIQNAPAGARLDAWWDFNRDGTWIAGPEQIADNLPVVNGDNVITFDIPATALDGLAYARFRVSTQGDLPTSGSVLNGEVEDYFLPLGSASDATFAGQTAISFTTAQSVATADLNGDGDLDIVAGRNGRVSWHENRGGTFAAERQVGTTTSDVTHLKVGDIDGDGDIDVFAASANFSNVSWYQNNGSGAFTARTLAGLGSLVGPIESFDLGDVDGDDDLDILIGGGTGVAWAHNTHPSGILTSLTYQVISTNVKLAAVTAADLDNDGDMDALAGSRDTASAWFENDGSLNFTAHVFTSLGETPRAATPADVDGDGDFDVVVALGGARDLKWYENDGAGGWTLRTIEVAAGALKILTDDIDGDGDLDLAITTSSQVRWYENDGLENFTPHLLKSIASDVTAAVGDLDGDGRLDVALAQPGSAPIISWMRQIAAFDYGDAPSPYSVGLGANAARHEPVGPTLGALRDAELDGVRHPHAAGEAEDDGVALGVVRVGAGAASVIVDVQNAPAGAKLDAWVDFNGDGSWSSDGEHIAIGRSVVEGDNELTFAVPAWAAAGVTYARFRVSTSGGLGVNGLALDGEVEDYALTIEPPEVTTGLFSGPNAIAPGSFNFMVTADVDGDGDVDVVTKSTAVSGSVITWMENQGGGVFEPHALSAVGMMSEDFAAGDLDGDGDVDFVGLGVTQLVWLENDGEQNFTLRTASLGGSFPTLVSLAIADMDDDGDNDVLATQLGGPAGVYLLTNNGHQQFAMTQIGVMNGLYATSVVAADMDGDGDLDAVVGGSGGGGLNADVVWFQNNGPLPYTSRAIKPHTSGVTSTTTEGVAVGDLDGDGDLDVVAAANAGSFPGGRATLTWHEQIENGAFLAHTLDVGRNLRWATLADMDGDGDLDILTSGQSTSIDLYENLGNLQFARRQVSASQSNGLSVAAADIDGDGDLDPIGINISIDVGVAWFENRDLDQPDYGDAPATYGTLHVNDGAVHGGGGPRLGALRDADDDGQPATAADADAGDDGVTFGVLQAGSVAATVTVDVQNAPAGARLDAWIDFDGNGEFFGFDEHIAENLAVVEGENTITISIAAGAASGPTVARFRISTAGGLGPRGFAADGEVEDYAVVIAPPTAATGEYGPFQSRFGSGQAVIETADIDGDGDLDVLHDGFSYPYLVWEENLGDGAFLAHNVMAASGTVYDATIVDFDRDGDMDFVVLQSSQASWLENDGQLSFRRRTIGSVYSSSAGMAVADAEGDGDLDVLTYAPNSTIVWYLNNGAQSFTSQSTGIPLNFGTVGQLRVADMDRDGDLDVITVAFDLAWYENRGGLYTAHVQASGSGYRDVVVADLDGDGDLDLAARTSILMDWFENVGSPTLARRPLGTLGTPNGQSRSLLAVVDADGDGDFDILSAESSRPRWYRNEGAGAFTSLFVGPTPGPGAPLVAVAGLTAADLNGDGRVEVLVISMSNGSGWYEALPFGDYDRNGRVDAADRALWEATLGQTVATPGLGADGDRSGVIDNGDLDVWTLHAGEAPIPSLLAANGDFMGESIDGADFLSWQRNLGRTAPPAFSNDWDRSGTVDAGDLAVWRNHYGAGLIPNTSWIFSSAPASEANANATAIAESADVAATEPAIAANVILEPEAATAPARPAYVPRWRSVLAARDASLARLAEAPAMGVAYARLITRPTAEAKPQDETGLVDAVFAGLADDAAGL